jgi:iron complex outermembrane receptor protein
MGLIWQVAAPGPTGRVVESSSGRPIAGAEVSVVGRPGSTRTDADGRFVWLSPPVMPAVVVVTLQDGRMMRPVRVPSVAAGMPVTIAVEPLVHETMTVTGVSDVKETAPGAASFRIGRADLALRHPATLVQALEAVPGVSAIGEGQAAVPVIRGQARGRSLILVDGARATSERRAGANAAFVDPGTVRSIEILRGPGSVAYGSDAFGGVIAIRQHGPDRTEGWRGRLSGTFGAGVPERRGEIEVSRGYGSGAFLVGVRRRTFDDYKAPTGPVINSAWRDGGARLAW